MFRALLTLSCLPACIDGATPEAPAGHDLSCLGAVRSAPAPNVIGGLVIDEVGAAPIAGATVEALGADRSLRATTNAEGSYAVAPDPATGPQAALPLRVRATGYLDSYTFDPIGADERIHPMLAPADADRLYQLAGRPRDPELGTLLVLPLDCRGMPLQDATVSVTGSAGVLYLGDETSFDPAATRTSVDAAALVLGVPPGPAGVTVTTEDATFTVSTTSVAGALTSVRRDP